MKKGEIKVTVIATSFGTDVPKKSLFAGNPEVTTSKPLVKDEPREQVKKEIHNTIEVSKSTNISNNEFLKKVEKKTEPIEDIIIEDDTDDWSAVPAFLR